MIVDFLKSFKILLCLSLEKWKIKFLQISLKCWSISLNILYINSLEYHSFSNKNSFINEFIIWVSSNSVWPETSPYLAFFIRSSDMTYCVFLFILTSPRTPEAASRSTWYFSFWRSREETRWNFRLRFVHLKIIEETLARDLGTANVRFCITKAEIYLFNQIPRCWNASISYCSNFSPDWITSSISSGTS